MLVNPQGSGTAAVGSNGRGPAFNGGLHPRAPAGATGGGRFVAGGGGGGGSSSGSGGSKTAKGKKTAKPNGLGYSASQWAQLQQLEAKAKAGGKLDAHQKHLLHQAHKRRLAAMGTAPKAKAAAAPKPKVKVPKVKAKVTPKPRMAGKPRRAPAPPRTAISARNRPLTAGG
jgi:hypothetical protein